MQAERKRLSIADVGKLPPQAIEMEESILGAILLQKDAFAEAAEILKVECFYKDSHQKIFAACQRLYNQSRTIDSLTVLAELKSTGELEIVGGLFTLMELTAKVSNHIPMQHYSAIVFQKYLQREVIAISGDSINKAYDDTTDVFELIEENQASTFSLLSTLHSRETADMSSLVMDCISDLEIPMVDGLTGVGTGFKGIDKITGGWQASDLIIIAARPAMGKTAFVLKCASNAAIVHNVPTLIFSLEMSAKQLTHRLVSDESNILYERIRRKTLTEFELGNIHKSLADLAKAPIYIDDTPALNVFDFKIKARRMKQKYDIGLIVIDYLQLMNGDMKIKNGNREQEISLISRTLKQVAKELDIPVIALSQLSRAVESRPGSSKRPMLSDLRDSGSIEQDADMVGFLYRPEYYGITESEDGETTVGLCELIFGKNRAGVCDTVKLDFNGAFMRFKDWEDSFTPAYSEPPPVPHSDFRLMPSKEWESNDDPPF